MVKLIAMDLDGTLLNHKGMISSITLNALNKVHKKDIKLVLCSGRPLESAMPIIRQLSLDEKKGYYIGMNGQIIHSFKTKTTIEYPLLKDNEIKTILKISQNYPVIANLAYEKTNYLISTKKYYYIAYLFKFLQKGYWIFRQNDIYEKTKIIELSDLEIKETGKICFLGTSKSLKRLNDDIIDKTHHTFSSVLTSSIWMETQHSYINKASALKKVAEIENIESHEIIAFGDGENDILMLKYAGVGIAMKNAMKSVKEIADDVCPSNQDDGIAHYLYNYILNE